MNLLIKIKRIGMFKISVVAFFYIFPVISIGMTSYFENVNISNSAFRWIIFWGIGMRLFTCGLKQSFQPEFTANNIFSVTQDKAYPIVRELGFANISLGFCGILSMFFITFRTATAFIGFIYYSLALIQHLSRKFKNESELFATITDFTIVIELLLSFILYKFL
jgi:hypothetical protein